MEFTPGSLVWARRLATLMFPSSCLTCPTDVSFEQGPVCAMCLASLERRPQHRKTAFLDNCVSAGPFDGTLKQLIHRYKYSGKDYVSKALAGFVLKQWPQAPFAADALLAVPMPYWRELWRGYNQSFLLAHQLGKKWGLPVLKGGLKRRWNRSQTNLSRDERLKNAATGFQPIKNKSLVSKRILLIDDVLTTGATLDACARVLKVSGVQRVYGLTVAYEQRAKGPCLKSS